MMTRRVFSWRLLAVAALTAVEALVLLTLSVGFAPPAQAQFFDGGFFPFQNPWGRSRRSYRPSQGYYGQERRPEADYSKAPAPKKADTPPQSTVLVFGDSFADWLAYGLEQSFAESPEMGVLRKPRSYSGLIRQEPRSDPRGEHPDWPSLIKEVLAAEKPDFIVMMIGLNDRRQIREQRPPRPPIAKQGQPQDQGTDPKKAQEGAQQQQQQQPAPGTQAAEPEVVHTYEFHTDKWTELYIKRIDETIAALKSAGVPVFWVGLPPVRGARSTTDFSFLNDLFRSRADKSGIMYVDVWDGFVDESGNFALQGPDVEGQNRRLRTPDGVYFTEFGARKLAHFLERELQRWMTTRGAPSASLPAPVVEEPARSDQPKRPDSPAGITRPLAGPVISLTATRATEDDDILVGGGKSREAPAAVDAVAAKVLAKGEPVFAPAGRADDFAWPRREIAPVGADPTVVIATLPLTPMKSEQKAAVPTPEGPQAPPAPGAPGQARPPGTPPQTAQRPSGPRQQTGWFGNWGGWQQGYRQAPQQRSQPGFFPFLFRR